MKLYNGDCLELMKKIPDGSVDMILDDIPYGTTDCAFDKRLPFEPMWEQFKRVTKHNAAIVLFSQLPFAVDLISANRKMFRYEYVWHKSVACGFLNANKMPLRAHENILVFYRALPTYKPQFRTGKAFTRVQKEFPGGNVYQRRRASKTVNDGNHYYPRDVLEIKSINGASKTEPRYHPTQKPVALLEYLIKTYTNAGETVLDATMGSGTTGVACVDTGRKFIGIELDEGYFKIAQERIAKAQALKAQELF